MRPTLWLPAAVAVILGMVAVGAAWGAATPEDTLEEVRAAIAEGRYEEAASAASNLERGTKDDAVKTEAMRLRAVALRKKGDWAAAAKAYKSLAGRFEAGSEEQVRYEAAGEVLAASLQGRYAGVEGTLAEDGVLAEATVRVGEARAAKLAARVAALKTARTPQEVVAVLGEVLEGYGEARILAPNVPEGREQEAAQAAGDRLEALAKEAKPKLQQKLEEFNRTIGSRGTVDSVRVKQLEEYHDLCMKMAEAEDAFQSLLKKVEGEGWPERLRLERESEKRGREYGVMAQWFNRPLTRPWLR